MYISTPRFLFKSLGQLFIFSKYVTASGSCNVKQLSVIVFEKCPGEETCLQWDYFDCQIKTVPANQASHGTARQFKKWHLWERGFWSNSKAFLHPLVAGKLLFFMTSMIARMMVFKATVELESKRWEYSNLKCPPNSLFLLRFSFFYWINIP